MANIFLFLVGLTGLGGLVWAYFLVAKRLYEEDSRAQKQTLRRSKRETNRSEQRRRS